MPSITCTRTVPADIEKPVSPNAPRPLHYTLTSITHAIPSRKQATMKDGPRSGDRSDHHVRRDNDDK